MHQDPADQCQTVPDPALLAQALSARECDILALLAEGNSNRAIADSLNIAIGTVKRHLANAYPKLGVSSRLAAVVQFRRLDAQGQFRKPHA